MASRAPSPRAKAPLATKYDPAYALYALAANPADAAVAAAYGWPDDLTDEQVLERLLALNLERAAEEAKAAKARKPRASREKTDEEML